MIQEEGLSYKVSSSGTNSGGVSSIEIDDAEYSLRTRGINLAVYNKNTGKSLILLHSAMMPTRDS